MEIKIPYDSSVVLVGAPLSGKTSFSDKYLTDKEDILVCDDLNIAKADRQKAISYAKEHDKQTVCIVFNLDGEVLAERNRKERKYRKRDIIAKADSVKMISTHLDEDGFNYIYILNNEEEINNCEVIFERLNCDKKELSGPFDIIGDVHGCYYELCKLLKRLGYKDDKGYYYHAERTAVFTGDFTDKGNNNVKVLKLIRDMVNNNTALAVLGNHDDKILRYLNNNEVVTNKGMNKTLNELTLESEEEKNSLKEFLEKLPAHLVLDNGKLIVVHAGIKKEYVNKVSRRVKEFCLYAETTQDIDGFNIPQRTFNWTGEWTDDTLIIYGHTPRLKPYKLNNTLCIDTGCVLGGSLSAYKYPEDKVTSTSAKKNYLKDK